MIPTNTNREEAVHGRQNFHRGQSSGDQGHGRDGTSHLGLIGRSRQLDLHDPGPPGPGIPAQGHLHRRRPNAGERAPRRRIGLRRPRDHGRDSSTPGRPFSRPSRGSSTRSRNARRSVKSFTRSSGRPSRRANAAFSSRERSPRTSSRPRAASKPSTTSSNRSGSIPRRASGSRSSSPSKSSSSPTSGRSPRSWDCPSPFIRGCRSPVPA